MTRSELNVLKHIVAMFDNGWRHTALDDLRHVIADVEREHAKEDRHNDWAELAEQPLPIAAE